MNAKTRKEIVDKCAAAATFAQQAASDLSIGDDSSGLDSLVDAWAALDYALTVARHRDQAHSRVIQQLGG